MKHWKLGLAGLLLFATTAWAGNDISNGAPFRSNPNGSPQSGVYWPDTTGRVLSFDLNGNVSMIDADRDRDFSQVINLGISGVSLGWGVSYSSNSNQFLGRYVGQYSRGAINITYGHATAADSDSVCLAVYIYGTNSSTSANRMLWTPLTGVVIADTCFDNSTTANKLADSSVAHCFGTIPSFYITRSPRTGAGGTFLGLNGGVSRNPIRRWPLGIYRWPSSAGIWLPLADNAGNTIPFAYITVVVQNVFPNATGNITNLEVNYWPRVN